MKNDLAGEVVSRVQENIFRVFVGKKHQVHLLLLGFFCGLHVLIEDVPGVGKTTLARTLAASTGLDFGRIQFTPDLLPGDIIGMSIWDPEKHDFAFKEGAIMHCFVLADEINRASPRTQSSLLEAMQEGTVTVDGNTRCLPEPFFVIATQNPEQFIGAFPLPEGELDRFGISFSLGYPGEQEETEILDRFREQNPLDSLTAVCTGAEITAIRKQVRMIHVAEAVKRYIVRIARDTRHSDLIKLGSSPRATQHLLLAAQSEAFMAGRNFTIPEDVLTVAPHVLAHRLVLSTEARLSAQSALDILQKITSRIPVPTGLNER